MTEVLIAVGALFLVAAAIWTHFNVVRPVRDLLDALRRLADGQFPPVALRSKLSPLQNAATRIRKISDRLQEQNRQLSDEGFSLRAILSSMVEGVAIVDRSERIRLVNDALTRMFALGQSPINRQVIEVFRQHELREALARTLESGQAQQIELVLPPSGEGQETRVFSVYSVGLYPGAAQKPLGAIIVFYDVTEIRKLESVRREFVANVSHEFRTPLAIINGYLETLLDGALDDREMAEQSLRVMQRHGHRLNLLIDDLLVISQLEHRSIRLQPESVEIREAVDRVVDQMRSQLEARGAEVSVEVGPGAECVEADPIRLEQVLMNLFTNALQHNAEPTVRLRITSARTDGQVKVEVTDDGPGIPLADQPHIFERFYRVRKDRSRDGGGTGLGLSIVKNVIAAHGGVVGVRSRPGEGASFSFTLPAPAGAGSVREP